MLKIVIALMFVSSAAFASNFDKGLNHYRTANFVQAKVEFQNALRSGSNRSGYGKIYKYLGLSQYMLGETREAKASFGYALHYDPSVELYPNEVLDSSVLEFFLNVKQKLKTKPIPKRRAKKHVVSKAKKTAAPIAVKPSSNKPKLGTSRKPQRSATKKPSSNRQDNKVRRVVKQNTVKKTASSQPSATRKQVKKPKPTVSVKKKQPNMFSGKKPPKVIIVDNSNTKKQHNKKRGYSSYQDLLPTPSSKVKSVRVKGSISAWSFLPFGAGQYAAGRYKLGHLFAIGSIGGMVTAGAFYWAYLEQESNYDDLMGWHRQCVAGTLGGCKTPEGKRASMLKIKQSLEEHNNDLHLNQIGIWSGVGVFGLLWVGGIIEAVVNRSSPISYVYFDRKSLTLAINYPL